MRGLHNPRSSAPITESVPTDPSQATYDGIRPHILTKLLDALLGSRFRETPDAARSGSSRDQRPISLYPF